MTTTQLWVVYALRVALTFAALALAQSSPAGALAGAMILVLMTPRPQ